jgi:hypothetical protein
MRRRPDAVGASSNVRAQAELLHDARAKAFEEAVGALDQAQHELDAVGLLQVDADRAPAAIQQIERRAAAAARTRSARSTRRTSAPMSASIIAQNGPGPMPAISMIRMPSSGPTWISFAS